MTYFMDLYSPMNHMSFLICDKSRDRGSQASWNSLLPKPANNYLICHVDFCNRIELDTNESNYTCPRK